LEIYHSSKVWWYTLFLFFLLANSILAQSEFTGASARWDDSAREWEIFSFVGEDEYESENELRLKWPLKNDWTEWTFDYNNNFNYIKLKWPNDPGHWELRTEDGAVVSIKTKWRNDFTEWVIEMEDLKINWISEYRANMSSWYFESDELGYLNMYTAFRGDPRDWLIEDHALEMPDEIKMAAIFISIYLTNPKQ